LIGWKGIGKDIRVERRTKMPKRNSVMQVASNESFRFAKEELDRKIREAVDAFVASTPDCKLVDMELFMNGWEEGVLYDGNGTIDRIRLIIEVI